MKKKLFTLLMTAIFSLLFTMLAFAGQWKQDAKGWWWDNGNGTYPKSAWQWCDGNNDGTAECFYFDGNGYCLMNTTTPDGYTVNKDGAWIVNGAIQTKWVGISTATSAGTTATQNTTSSSNSSYSNSNSGISSSSTSSSSSGSSYEEVVYTGHYYATPYGKCYHYSAECAGKNAKEITAEAAARLKPCGTCVE